MPQGELERQLNQHRVMMLQQAQEQLAAVGNPGENVAAEGVPNETDSQLFRRVDREMEQRDQAILQTILQMAGKTSLD